MLALVGVGCTGDGAQKAIWRGGGRGVEEEFELAQELVDGLRASSRDGQWLVGLDACVVLQFLGC